MSYRGQMRRIQRAAAIGVIAEFILITPLLLISHFQITDTVLVYVPIESLVAALEELQWPSLPLIERLYRTQWMAHFAAQFPHSRWVMHAAGWLVIFVQTMTFALVAFVFMYIYELRKTMQRGSSAV